MPDSIALELLACIVEGIAAGLAIGGSALLVFRSAADFFAARPRSSLADRHIVRSRISIDDEAY